MFMNLVCWLVVGVIAGLIAGKFVNQRGDDPKMAIGFAALGAAVFGFVFAYFSTLGVNEFNTRGVWGALIGAAVVLVGWHAARGFASRA